MPPDAPRPDDRSAHPDGVHLRSDGTSRAPLPAERARLEPEQEGEDDRLEAPGVRTPLILGLAAGFLAFIAVALVLLQIVFRLEIGRVPPVAQKTFPTPQLETNIDPRTLPADQPGAAEVFRPVAPVGASPQLERAMRVIAAKGAHAYDPLPSPTPAPAQSGGPR